MKPIRFALPWPCDLQSRSRSVKVVYNGRSQWYLSAQYLRKNLVSQFVHEVQCLSFCQVHWPARQTRLTTLIHMTLIWIKNGRGKWCLLSTAGMSNRKVRKNLPEKCACNSIQCWCFSQARQTQLTTLIHVTPKDQKLVLYSNYPLRPISLKVSTLQ